MTVKDEILIKECVSSLYKAISCAPGTEPEYSKIKELFLDNGMMAEYEKIDSEVPNIKTIEEHISEIKDVFKNYPFVSKKGFYENELSIQIMKNGPVATVYSEYEKKYYNGKKDVINIGCNIMQLVKINKEYKILSVSWYEK